MGPAIKMVSKRSASVELPRNINRRNPIPITYDHSEMVKFTSGSDANYITAKNLLKQFLEQAPTVIRNRFSDLGDKGVHNDNADSDKFDGVHNDNADSDKFEGVHNDNADSDKFEGVHNDNADSDKFEGVHNDNAHSAWSNNSTWLEELNKEIDEGDWSLSF